MGWQAFGRFGNRLQRGADGGGDFSPVRQRTRARPRARAQQANLARRVPPRRAMAGVWSQHVCKFMQNDVTGLRRGQPADRGDLNQRQRLIRFPAPCTVECGEGTLAQPDAEHELHLTERCRRGRILLAHRDGGRGEVVLVGDHLPAACTRGNSGVRADLWKRLSAPPRCPRSGRSPTKLPLSAFLHRGGFGLGHFGHPSHSTSADRVVCRCESWVGPGSTNQVRSRCPLRSTHGPAPIVGLCPHGRRHPLEGT